MGPRQKGTVCRWLADVDGLIGARGTQREEKQTCLADKKDREALATPARLVLDFHNRRRWNCLADCGFELGDLYRHARVEFKKRRAELESRVLGFPPALAFVLGPGSSDNDK